MTRKIFLLLLLAAATLQSCHKSEVAKKGASYAIENSSGLALNSVGQYGAYQLINGDGGLSAEVANFSLVDGGTGDLATYTGAAHQKYRITYVGGGYFTLMNLGSGKFAQSYNYKDAQVLIQATYTGSDAQLWAIAPISDKYYKAINKADGLAITGNGASAMITLAPYTGAASQTWGYNLLANAAYRDDQVVNFFHRKHGSISFDQGNSIPLTYGANHGKVVWVTEDTYTQNDNLQPNGEYKCGWFFDIHNSLLLQPANHSWDESQTNNIITHNSPYTYEALASPGGHNSTETWPGVGVEIGNHVYMYAYEGPPANGFNKTVIYDFTENATGGLDWGTGVRHEVAGVSDQDSISYSTGMVKPGDGYVYAYGTVGIFIFKNVYVARFAESDPFNWTFWNGTTWAAKPTTAKAAIIQFIGHDDGTLANTAVSYINGKYVMMQMDLGFFCDNNPHDIYMSTSSSPTGPFTNKVEVFTIEDMINGHLCNYYTPCIHPEFTNGKNELLVTYCLNYTACQVSTCTNGYLDPNYYQVKGVRIPYSVIGL